MSKQQHTQFAPHSPAANPAAQPAPAGEHGPSYGVPAGPAGHAPIPPPMGAGAPMPAAPVPGSSGGASPGAKNTMYEFSGDAAELSQASGRNNTFIGAADIDLAAGHAIERESNLRSGAGTWLFIGLIVIGTLGVVGYMLLTPNTAQQDPAVAVAEQASDASSDKSSADQATAKQEEKAADNDEGGPGDADREEPAAGVQEPPKPVESGDAKAAGAQADGNGRGGGLLSGLLGRGDNAKGDSPATPTPAPTGGSDSPAAPAQVDPPAPAEPDPAPVVEPPKSKPKPSSRPAPKSSTPRKPKKKKKKKLKSKRPPRDPLKGLPRPPG